MAKVNSHVLDAGLIALHNEARRFLVHAKAEGAAA